MATVQVKDLSKIYGRQKAVDNITFTVEKGDVVGFLGPNGAGKSTTMKILTGYLLPTDGTASVAGKDIYNDSLKVRSVTGYLPEHNPLYHEMYVREYLQFMARIHKISNSRKRINDLTHLTGLDPERHKKIGALSKGYRQRVGLAQAMLHDPEVLILDEPTSGLDPNQIVEIRNLISEVGRTKTVILSTHIMQEVQAMCNRVIIINQGQLVADSPTEQLQHRYTGKEYVRVQFKSDVTREKLLQIQGVDDASGAAQEWLLRSKARADIREKIFRFAAETNNPLMMMNKEGQSLENIFRQLTDSPKK